MSRTLPVWLDVKTLRWLADEEEREAEVFRKMQLSDVAKKRLARATKLRTYATRVERKQQREDGA